MGVTVVDRLYTLVCGILSHLNFALTVCALQIADVNSVDYGLEVELDTSRWLCIARDAHSRAAVVFHKMLDALWASLHAAAMFSDSAELGGNVLRHAHDSLEQAQAA